MRRSERRRRMMMRERIPDPESRDREEAEVRIVCFERLGASDAEKEEAISWQGGVVVGGGIVRSERDEQSESRGHAARTCCCGNSATEHFPLCPCYLLPPPGSPRLAPSIHVHARSSSSAVDALHNPGWTPHGTGLDQRTMALRLTARALFCRRALLPSDSGLAALCGMGGGDGAGGVEGVGGGGWVALPLMAFPAQRFLEAWSRRLWADYHVWPVYS
uniref:Uncharacterized protein LOC116939291 n=1 Tax=Petromyzon marinus TaxID=7757 RepID=A0AAJ7WMU2_PETMA|nr:uncharacterized protein LOC116939291 [Petromyzon marinus]